MVSRNAGSDTPMTWRVAPAGLVSGPRKLKIVRTASSLRTGTTWRVAPWWAGANMKPKPASSMHCATASGVRSMRTPSASSRSAEPDSPVAERLPCLATAQPAPAAISAAVVETLKVGRPPPVPAVSIRSSRLASTGVASSRIVVARPTSSSIVSPFVRSAISTAAVWASEALPAMISASTPAVCSADRSRRAASASIASVSTSLGKERLQQPLAVGREHRLGVELDALGGQLAVAHRHQHAAAPRGRLELAGQRRGRPPASGSARRSADSAGPRTARCRRARSRSSCRGWGRGARPCRRTPGRATGGRGRRRASAPRPRGSAASPRPRCPPRWACTGPARRPRGPSRPRAARRRAPRRCARPRPPPPARPGTGRGCR